MTNFKKLTSQAVRDYWKDEARDFTPWLAKKENLENLENVLELDLEVVEKEKPVGSYSLDILAKEEQVEEARKVIIENQLQKSDHDHLGKSIAYAAGIDADVIVWIAPKFNDEHLDALGWLNENSREAIDFFAIRLDVYKIADSPPAVKFTAVEKPSEWKEKAKRGKEELTENQRLRENFWGQLRDKIEERETPLRPKKPHPGHWYRQPIGKGGFKIKFAFNVEKSRLYCTFLIKDDAEAYQKLKSKKEQIENRIGEELTWIPPEETAAKKERAKIRISRDANIKEKEEWKEYQDWFIDQGERFMDVFKELAQKL